jgi:hypothetical protein
LGPFPSLALVEKYAYHLQLPRTMQIHNIFCLNLLEIAANIPPLGHQILFPPLVEIHGELEWEVTEVLNV